jgi:urease gamma subunit
MRLSPSDQDKLLLAVAGMLARDRRARGVKLNRPEAVALLSCWVIEAAREGRSVADLMEAGWQVLRRDEVMRACRSSSPRCRSRRRSPTAASSSPSTIRSHDPG